MIRRVPQFAEREFAKLCAVEGALCNPSKEDEGGWDFFVEFSLPSLPAPADMHPPRKTAFVQVKSTRKNQLSCRVKLSNMLLSVQSCHPWFIVLVIADSKAAPARIYAVHIWEQLIRRTLKATRCAETKNTALNKRDLTIRFDAADERGDQLLSWMHGEIEAVGSDYEQQKKDLAQTIGYEGGYGIAQVPFKPATEDEILANFLGLGSGIPLSRFVYTPARFGIQSAEPEIDVTSGTIHITPESTSTCEVRVHDPNGSATIAISGYVYSVGLPGLPFERSRIRFSADFLEIVWSRSGKADCRLNFDGCEKKELLSIENFSTLIGWCKSGPVEVQIWSDGERTIRGSLSMQKSNMNLDWARITRIVRLLRSIAGPVKQSQVRLSLADLDSAARDLIAFQQLVEAPSVRLEFEASSETPPEFSSIIYYIYASVYDCTFYALLERPVREDVAIEGRRRMTCGLPQLVEAYSLKNASEAQRKMMNNDYDRYLHRQEEAGTPLGLGDAHVFLKLAQGDRA
jgi:hypothetical protein